MTSLKQQFEETQTTYFGYTIHFSNQHHQTIIDKFGSYLTEEADSADEGECCFTSENGGGGDEVITSLITELKNLTLVMDFTEIEDGESVADWFISYDYKNGKIISEDYERCEC